MTEKRRGGRLRQRVGGTALTEPGARRTPSGRRVNKCRTTSLPWQEIVRFFEERRDAGKSPDLAAKRLAVGGGTRSRGAIKKIWGSSEESTEPQHPLCGKVHRALMIVRRETDKNIGY